MGFPRELSYRIEIHVDSCVRFVEQVREMAVTVWDSNQLKGRVLTSWRMWIVPALTMIPIMGIIDPKMGIRHAPNATVFLPPPRVIKEREDEEPGPLPGEPPKIWGATRWRDHINKPCNEPMRAARGNSVRSLTENDLSFARTPSPL